MPLARLHDADIANGNIVDADDLKEEFDQLVNILNGTSTNKDAIIKLSSATLAPLLLNQANASGPVQIWQLNGTDKLKVNNLAQLESLLATGTAPFIVASTTKVINLNADLLDGLSSADFGQIGVSKIPFTYVAKFDDPSTFPTGLGPIIRVPAIQSGFITKITAVFNSGSHSAGGSVTFSVQKNFAGTVGSISLTDTNNTINTFYTSDFADESIAEGNAILIYISARSGTVNERDVSVIVEGYQTLKA